MAGHFTPSTFELDCLWGVIESVLRIRKRHQLFSWAQGILQSVLRHELLICALAANSPGAVRAEIVAAVQTPSDQLEAIRNAHPGLVAQLARIWEAGHLEPFALSVDAPNGSIDPLVRQTMQATGLRNLAVHGSFDRNGNATTLFAFGQLPERPSAIQLGALEVLVPYLHGAFLRVHMDARPTLRPRAAAQDLTGRELEILRHLQGGHSNTEIGRVLAISPLTVKNHVQKILRKLRAQNRTEAVAKGLSLELLQVQHGSARVPGDQMA